MLLLVSGRHVEVIKNDYDDDDDDDNDDPIIITRSQFLLNWKPSTLCK